jgi:hypothetical protein
MDQRVKEILCCSICLEFPKNPVECTECSNLFCLECIYEWFDRSHNYFCPHRCEFGSIRAVQGFLRRLINCSCQPESERSPDTMDIVNEKSVDWQYLISKQDPVKSVKPCLAILYKLSNSHAI